jgi:hypothetical protein
MAAVSGENLMWCVIWLIIGGLVFGLLNWLIDYCEIQPPFNKIAKVVAAIGAVIMIINALFSLAGKPFIVW